ncbi:Prp18 domain-containing protein [Colletotrichum nymphaeae SA-01]|uniref:Prp18 domain-containing protein n=1 Tax=Colletotrichum nymphaeae SA-01 TaxID=1460502 RepID=A0A135SRG7_9PEZI|nr:Prp18 domain-containing protein [Colletotrichum nymphaeae SA-01]
MDFAALMSKELDKSKKPTSTAAAASSSSKYIKRADVEAKRREDYLAEQARVEAEREAKAAAKRKREEDDAAEHKIREEKRQKLAEESRRRREEKEAEEERARRKRLGLPELVKATAGDDDDAAVEEGMEDIPDGQLAEKLRALGEPATLFGEGHGARLRRYRRLTTVLTKGPIPTTLQLVEEKDMKVDAAVPKDKEGRRWLFRQLASYFTMVLAEYEKAMEAERRDTTASKTAYSAMVQSRENLKPLFRKFEKYDLDDDLLAPIIEIFPPKDEGWPQMERPRRQRQGENQKTVFETPGRVPDRESGWNSNGG